ncbi:MAG: hypothetical protein QOJ59_377, partial [Thermomicrobiales bacterium]|nr:hypothetical protein [Thermomicrobiales bacterium]
MIHSWIARLVMVAALASVAWCGEGSALARTAEERFPIVVDADGVPHLPVSAVAGPTRVTLDNLTTASFGVSLYLIPPAVANRIASVTPTADGADTADGTHVPDWLGETTPIGGPGIAGPDGRTEAVVDLLPGTYVLVFDFFPPQAGTLTSVVLNYADGSPFLVTVQDLPEPTQTPRPTRTPSPRATRTPSQVTPDNPLATSEPEAEPTEEDDASEEPTGGAGSSEETSTVVMTDDGFLLPAAFPIGLQTWEVVNQGQQPHALIVVAV